MISGEFTRKIDVDAEILMTPIRTLYASGDKNAHTFELSLYRNKEPLKIDGAGVIGYFLRADGCTVPVNGTASGNVAKVTLAESCYTVVGQFNLIIKVTVGSERKAVFWGNGYVTRSQTDSVIDPGKTIPSLDELLAQIAAVEAATKAANTAASTANTAASNADQKASIADTAASTANASAKTANASAAAANTATASANAAARKIDDMTVTATGLAPGEAPTAVLTDEDGHYNLALGLTKGDTGDTGVYMGEEEPTDPDVNVWIKPSGMPSGVIDNVAREEIAELSARQNILIGTETGTTVSAADAFAAPLCGLTIYGRSTQDSTPTPDAPVPIVSAGDGGSITATISDGADKQQTITLQTPNGLPGIRVVSGGNYTDENGQHWICDEIDLARGVHIQRIGQYTLKDVTLGRTARDNVYTIRNVDEIQNNAALTTYALLCTDYKNIPTVQYATKDCPISWSGDPYRQLRVYDERDQAEIIESLNSGNVRVDYVLGVPVETPLTDAEIAAYKALAAYAPAIAAEVADGAGLRLSYQRDVNLVIKNLEDAIASMTNN